MDKILDRSVSIAIIISSIVFTTIVINKYLFTHKRASDLPTTPIGKKLDFPDINWEGQDYTVIIALQEGCAFCSESGYFYRQLTQEVSEKNNLAIVAVLPNAVESSREYMKTLGVPINEIRQSPLISIGISSTPTLLIADKTGTVVSGWVGKLSSEKETEVLQILARLGQK